MKTVLFVMYIVVHVSQFGSCLTGSTAVGYAVGQRTIVLCYAYIYSSKHIFGSCIILLCTSSKKYSTLFLHMLSLY